MGDAAKKIKDFTSGYLAGLAGMPLAITPAVASDPLYLYGGAPLPPLPAEWDRKNYPYAVIVKITRDNKYFLIFYKSLNYRESIYGSTYFGTTEDGTALVFESLAAESSWRQKDGVAWTSYDFIVDRGYSSTVAIWTHGFDLMYSDNTLYVAASRPERIADWESLQGMYFYNDFIAPFFGNFTLPDEYHRYIVKAKTKYLFISCVGALGGAYIACDGGNAYIYNGEWDYIITVHSRDVDGDVGTEWQFEDSLRNYLGDEYEANGNTYHYLCSASDIIWSEDDIKSITTSAYVFAGTDRIPVPEPPEVTIDNKAIMLGCRLGYIIRAKLGKGQVEIPDGVLISSDGYILCDCDGVYLIASDEDTDAVPEGALISSDGYILKDSKGRYLIARRKLDG